MRSRRLITLLAATAAALAAAAPAHAQAVDQTSTGQFLFSPSLGTANISVECAAAAPAALRTEVLECYLLGEDGSRRNADTTGGTPGAADAVTAYFESIPTQNYRVCVRSSAQFLEGAPVTAAVECNAAAAAGDNTLVQNASAHNVGKVPSSTVTDMWGRCTALAPGAVSTKILECFLHGKTTGTNYHAGTPPVPDGPVAWSSRLWEGILMEPFEICVRSTATFADGETITLPRECVTT